MKPQNIKYIKTEIAQTLIQKLGIQGFGPTGRQRDEEAEPSRERDPKTNG